MASRRPTRINKTVARKRRERLGPTQSVIAKELGLDGGGNGATPRQLCEWIESKSNAADSVYLVPASADRFYAYTVATSERALESGLFLTLSARGVNEFHRSDVRFVSLGDWVREHERYEALLRIRLFVQFRLAKSFGTWKGVVRRQKFAKAARGLEENSCVLGNRHMRGCYVRLRSQLAKLSCMGATDVQPKTAHVADFLEHQIKSIERFAESFLAFRELALKLTLAASRAAFAESGFSYDEYEGELAALRVLKDSVAAEKSPAPMSAGSFISMHQTPKKLTYIEQANKRQCCIKITNFIRLIDFIIRDVLFEAGWRAC